MKIHYGDSYLFQMQYWNPEAAKIGFLNIQDKKLQMMARYCDGKHGVLSSPEPTFNVYETTCLHCLKKLKKERKIYFPEHL